MCMMNKSQNEATVLFLSMVFYLRLMDQATELLFQDSVSTF